MKIVQLKLTTEEEKNVIHFPSIIDFKILPAKPWYVRLWRKLFFLDNPSVTTLDNIYLYNRFLKLKKNIQNSYNQ